MNGKMSFEFKFDSRLDHVQRKAVRAEIVKQIREKDQTNEWFNWCNLKDLPITTNFKLPEEQIEQYIAARLRTLTCSSSNSAELTVRKPEPGEADDMCCLVCGKVICYSLWDVYIGKMKWTFPVEVEVMDEQGQNSPTEVAVQIALSYEDDQMTADLIVAEDVVT